MKTNHNIIALAIHSAIALTLAGGLHAATKTVNVGNGMFGATVTANMSHSVAPLSGTCSFYTSATADGKVLYKQVPLGSGSANFRLAEGSNRTKAWGYLRVGSTTLATWDKTLTGSSNFSTPPIISIQKGGSIDVWLVTFSASASVIVRADGSVTCTTLPGGKTSVSAKAGPVIDTPVTAKASLFGLAGVDGALTLFKGTCVASAKMTPSTNVSEPNTSNVNYGFTFTRRSTHGSLTAWYDLPFVAKKTKVLAKWNGSNTAYNLGLGSFKLKAAPVVLLQ